MLTQDTLTHPSAYLYAVIIIFSTVYSSRLAVNLPTQVKSFLETTIARFIIVFIILLLSSVHFTVALTIAIVYALTIHLIQLTQTVEDMRSNIQLSSV